MAASPQHEKLRTAIGEITKKNGTISCAVAVHDFESDFRFAFKGDRVFHAASTIKVAILLAVMKAIDEGRFRLNIRCWCETGF